MSVQTLIEAWAVADCVDKLVKKTEENKDLLSKEDIDYLEFKQQHENFLHQQTILEVVDSIVSVLSGTVTEEAPYGAKLHHDGNQFHHSVDCECLCCLCGGGGGESIEEINTPRQEVGTPSPRPVRRRLFDENYQEDRTCTTCGMYESYSLENLNSGLIETNDWPPRHLCIGCYDVEMNVCYNCGQPNTWGIPCQCGLYFTDREGDQTYLGEYENEDLPENNSEKVKQVKDTVKEMGEFVYDLQEKLTEGEYLKLMDLLQKVTNDVNNL